MGPVKDAVGKLIGAVVVVTEANIAAEVADGKYISSSLSVRSVLYGEALLPGLGLVGLFSMLEDVLILLLSVEMPESYFPISEYLIGDGLLVVLGDFGLLGLLGLFGLMSRGVARGLWPLTSLVVMRDGVPGLFGSKPVGVTETFLALVASLGLPERGELM